LLPRHQVKIVSLDVVGAALLDRLFLFGQELDPKRFGDLEYTMKLIFNHDEEPVAPPAPAVIPQSQEEQIVVP